MVLFCHITTHVEGDPDPKLLEEKGGGGWPHLVFMDAGGDVLTTQGDRSIEGFDKTLGALTDMMKLEKMAKAGDKSAATPLFIAKLKLARYNFEEAKAKRKKLPSESKSQRKKIDKLFIGLEADEIIQSINRRDPDSAEAATDKLLAMHKAGRIPEGRAAGTFWVRILGRAEKNEDAKCADSRTTKTDRRNERRPAV